MEPRIWACSHLAGSVLRFETHRIIKAEDPRSPWREDQSSCWPLLRPVRYPKWKRES